MLMKWLARAIRAPCIVIGLQNGHEHHGNWDRIYELTFH
jgi:hypothetical protein